MSIEIKLAAENFTERCRKLLTSEPDRFEFTVSRVESGPKGIAQKLQALGCPYPHSDIQSSFWLLKQVHDNDLFKHSRELCDRFPELLKREAIR